MLSKQFKTKEGKQEADKIININITRGEFKMNENQLEELYPDSYDIKENQEFINTVIEID